ncbi:Increased rDNA silencing protein, partial [Ascosphaera atra]
HKDSVGAPKKGEEDVARLAAIREFEAAKSHKSSVGSRYGDEDAITVSSSRSPSPHGKAGLVGNLIQQFSLNAAGKAVDEQRRRSSIIPRDAAARKTSDAQNIAAKHAAGQSEVKKREADGTNSAAAASSVPNSYQTKSGVTIIYPERRERRSSSRNAQYIHNDGANGSRLNGPEDAKIASSLAARRIPNAMRGHPTPPLPPRRRRKDHSDQSPSPQRPLLKQTLRSDRNKEEEAEEKRKNHYRHHIIRNPHKHHEGDRKRWRVSITARERKRYEGLWAANRGLWITIDNEGNPRTPPEGLMELLPEGAAPENMMLNVVVEELWSRSRLSQDTLEAIWDLVSHTAYGMLSREEFVVGIWLIDQCLRGRKLPVKVPRSVWASTQTMPSVELIPPKRKH